MLRRKGARACALLFAAVLACAAQRLSAIHVNDLITSSTTSQGRSGRGDAWRTGEIVSDAQGGGRALASQVDNLESALNYTALECSRYDLTYSQIERDLEIHRKLGGISLEATRFAAERFGGVAMRGLTIGFFGGRAYLLSPTDFPGLRHHAPLHLAYMRMMLHLEDSFGAGGGGQRGKGEGEERGEGQQGQGSWGLPDVAFVLTTSDTPRHVSPLLVNSSTPPDVVRSSYGPDFVPGPYPLCGICKSDFFPDLLLVPNFHFHMKLYDKTFLDAIPQFNEVPWKDRKPVLFGRFSHYRTNRVSNDVFTYKTGTNGRRICYKGNRTCPFRDYFISKAAPKLNSSSRLPLDVSFIGRIPMIRHTHFKYLAHLDGQGISSRLEQVLPLGSLVVKEASGYYAYYYRSLLRHRVNLVEFWRGSLGSGPEDLVLELDWAADNDEAAAAVAAEGQRLAATYLTGNGRTCYWYRLLHGIRSALSYSPSLSQWPEAQPLRRVVEEQLLAAPGGKELYDLPWAP